MQEGLGYGDALVVVQNKRPWVSPNVGFVHQLQDFEGIGTDPSKLAERRPWVCLDSVDQQ